MLGNQNTANNQMANNGGRPTDASSIFDTDFQTRYNNIQNANASSENQGYKTLLGSTWGTATNYLRNATDKLHKDLSPDVNYNAETVRNAFSNLSSDDKWDVYQNLQKAKNEYERSYAMADKEGNESLKNMYAAGLQYVDLYDSLLADIDKGDKSFGKSVGDWLTGGGFVGGMAQNATNTLGNITGNAETSKLIERNRNANNAGNNAAVQAADFAGNLVGNAAIGMTTGGAYNIANSAVGLGNEAIEAVNDADRRYYVDADGNIVRQNQTNEQKASDIGGAALNLALNVAGAKGYGPSIKFNEGDTIQSLVANKDYGEIAKALGKYAAKELPWAIGTSAADTAVQSIGYGQDAWKNYGENLGKNIIGDVAMDVTGAVRQGARQNSLDNTSRMVEEPTSKVTTDSTENAPSKFDTKFTDSRGNVLSRAELESELDPSRSTVIASKSLIDNGNSQKPLADMSNEEFANYARELGWTEKSADMPQDIQNMRIDGDTQSRLDYLKNELDNERISYAELAELQGYKPEILELGDVQLAEAAGIPEDEFQAYQSNRATNNQSVNTPAQEIQLIRDKNTSQTVPVMYDNTGREVPAEIALRLKNIAPGMLDENGNIKVMYHGTPNGGFEKFRDGSYFTENKAYADGYQNSIASSLSPKVEAKNPMTYEGYLDIKKPFTLSDQDAKNIYLNEYIKGGNSQYYDPYTDYRQAIDNLDEVDWVEGENLREWLQQNHPEYDSLYLDEGGAGGYGETEYKWRGKSVVPFSGDQFINRNETANIQSPETELYRTLTGDNGTTASNGEEAIDLTDAFTPDMRNSVQKRNKAQALRDQLKTAAKGQKYAALYDSLDAKTAERAVQTGAPEALRKLGFAPENYLEFAKSSNYVNKVVSDIAEQSNVKVNVPDLVERLRPENLDVAMTDEAQKTYNKYIKEIVADGSSPDEYTIGKLLQESRRLGEKAEKVKGQNAQDVSAGLKAAKYKLRDIVVDAAQEAGLTGDMTNDNIANGLKKLGFNEKVQDYYTAPGSGEDGAPTLADYIRRSSLAEQARDMGTEMAAEKLTRSASKAPTNFLTRLYRASGLEAPTETLLRSVVAPIAGVATNAAGNVIGKAGDIYANIKSGEMGQKIQDSRTSYPQTFLYSALTNNTKNDSDERTREYIKEAGADTTTGTTEGQTITTTGTSNPATTVYNTIAGNTAGGFVSPNQGFNSLEEERAVYFFRPTGDEWTDMLSRAMRKAKNAEDYDALGQLYEMYQSALSDAKKTGSSSSTSELNATQQAQLAKLDSADSAINELEQLFEKAGGGKGPIAGNLQSIAGDWGWDSNARTYNDMAEGLVNQIAQAVGKTDSLNTEGEVKRALKLIPQLTDDAQTAKNKLEELRRMLSTTKASYQTAYGLNS